MTLPTSGPSTSGSRQTTKTAVDLLCVGIAVYDLVLTVDRHPDPDDKMTATEFLGCGGGTAANGAIAAARLGHSVALATYLGKDAYGDQHLAELEADGVDTRWIVRGMQTTPFSVVLVKPNGERALVNYRKEMPELTSGDVDLTPLQAGAVLLDGYHLDLARWVVDRARQQGIPTVLDADRVHEGSVALASQVTYLVASERFARDYTGSDDYERAAVALQNLAPNVVITLGERGVVWCVQEGRGLLPAFSVDAIDTTGAGDAFHGAFAAGVAAGYAWDYLLAYASAAGALCATTAGARPGMATASQLKAFLARHQGSGGRTR